MSTSELDAERCLPCERADPEGRRGNLERAGDQHGGAERDAGPFGGMRSSGIGRELGEEGLDAFREPKHVHIDYLMEKKSYWYPYAARKRAPTK